ncbi:MAG: bifunctional hydroxymethylpyrimidine kinase/phosphomethylpyrimidine kinase [Candidatus Nitrosotenuis sp.]
MNILCIGGSDPSSGAGIQSDIKAASALGANCFTVITAITAQNTSVFSHVESVSKKSIGAQLDSIFSDFHVDVIVIGMVYNSKIIQKIHSKLKDKKIPIVLDPVIESTTGGSLLKKSALDSLRKLVSISFVITPNVSEAEVLSGVKIRKNADLKKAAKSLSALGVKNVVITGHRFIKNTTSDFVYANGKHSSVPGKKIAGINHGSGCNFAIALAYGVAKKQTMQESVIFAKQFAYDAIRSSKKLGHGAKMTDPVGDKIKSELEYAIREFEKLDDVSLLIPECQTNFVFSKEHAKSTNDIVGVLGRIVKTGNQVMTAGDLEYGASKHVASAVLTMQKKFPQTRSALNMKFSDGLVRKFAKAKYKISTYDRKMEPKASKLKENSSISWGIKDAIKNSVSSPDVIYHKGDFGKEPMIIVFGKTPKQVVSKITKILGA